MPTNIRDPKSIVTPEAFEISPALLGLPLAKPGRRLGAIAIDLVIVGLLTVLLSNVKTFVWGGIALALIRLAFKKSQRVSQAAGFFMRASAGCLGFFIIVIVMVTWGVGRMEPEAREEALGEVITAGAELVPDEARVDIDEANYGDADTPAEALVAIEAVVEQLRELPINRDTRRRIVRASIPPDATWEPQADSLIEIALDRLEGAETPGSATAVATPEVDDLSDAEVLAALAVEQERDEPDADRLAALRARATVIVAADTLAALEDEVGDLRREVASATEAREEIEREMEANQSGVGAFADLAKDVWSQLGSAIGLWSLYFTVLLTVLKGQTIGKRLMRVRVLRLDGEPITWWSAFERAGGYAAGIATGLLGFAQVLWDPNRQCTHDKITGTVVVVEGGERVPGAWQEAWGKAERVDERMEP